LRNHKFRVGLNLTTTFLGEKSAPSEKILAMRMRKGPPPYVGMGPPNGLSGPGRTSMQWQMIVWNVLCQK